MKHSHLMLQDQERVPRSCDGGARLSRGSIWLSLSHAAMLRIHHPPGPWRLGSSQGRAPFSRGPRLRLPRIQGPAPLGHGGDGHGFFFM